MELRHLRYFVAVAEELHFGRAARRVGIAQPPFSQMIKNLENELGVSLLRRTRRHVELTEAGRQFLPEARAVLAHVERAAQIAQAAGRGDVGHVRVGFVSSAAYGLLPNVIRSFRVSHPGVRLELKEMTSEEQVQGLQAASLDVGFVREVKDVEGLHRLVIAREQLMAVLPARHPLARQRGKTLRLERLHADGFVIIAPALAPAFHEVVYGACLAAGFSPIIAQETRAAETVVHLVAASVGVSLVPASLVNLRRPGVVYRELARPVPTVEMSVMRARGP